jgi:membrane protein DedA with SNARE-associated domain
LENTIVHLIQSLGYLGVFVAMILESACIPLPSEIIMPFGGYLSWTGHLQLWWVILFGTLGNIVGSIIAYYVGKVGGRPLVKRYGRVIHLSEKHIQMSERWFEKRGEWAVLIGRVLPGVRTFISLPAGFAKMPVIRFTVFTAIGSLPWVAALAYAGYKLGQNWANVKHVMHPFTYAVAALLLIIIILVAFEIRRRKKMVGRGQ